MEKITLTKDLTVFYVEAESFPDGIMKAMETLHGRVPDSVSRTTYGISRPEAHGKIKYKAALEEKFEGEGKSFQCKTLSLKKGRYYSLMIKDYMKRVESISEAFREILKQPDLDARGYCVEVYENEKDVICMVRLKDE